MSLLKKVDSRGRVVIPMPYRKILGLKPYSDVVFTIDNGRIFIEKVNPDKLLEQFLTAIPKIKEPKSIDWDLEYYDQWAN